LFVCLFYFVNPHPESDTISQEKHNLKKIDKTTVWMKLNWVNLVPVSSVRLL